MIEIQNLTKVYKNGYKANDNINLDIAAGDVLGILGPNGAGKTTLVRQIVGLSKPTYGKIIINGQEIGYSRNSNKKYVSYFSQGSVLLSAQTAFETLMFTGIYKGLGKKEAEENANLLLDYFQLSDCKKAKMSILSGGQKKLIMLAATFIGNYPIMIFDEPTNDLDPVNRQRYWDLVKKTNKNSNTTFIIISHNLSEIETVANHIAIIFESKLITYDGIMELKNKYSSGYSISIRSEMQFFEEIRKSIDCEQVKTNENEIIIEVDPLEAEAFIKRLLPLVISRNAEIKIHKNTLSTIYRKIQEDTNA